MDYCMYNVTNVSITDMCTQGNFEVPDFFFENPLDQCTDND